MIWLLFPIVFSSPLVWAAACCGGGFASPSIVSGEERAQLTVSYLASEIKADVYADGYWKERSFSESIETYRLQGAHVFADRWQAGASVPLIERHRQGQSASGLGDLSATLAYEALPDWDYHPWRPKGITFLQVVAPTGRSIQQSTRPYQLDSRGRGFWAIGAGAFLNKFFGLLSTDVYASLDVHRSLPKDNLEPGWGGNFAVGAGYNWRQLRLGPSIVWTYEDPIEVKNLTAGSAERFATATLTASYLFLEDWSGSLSYSDQTVIGQPVNARLERSIMLQLQKRWSR